MWWVLISLVWSRMADLWKLCGETVAIPLLQTYPVTVLCWWLLCPWGILVDSYIIFFSEEGGFCGVESCAQASLPDSFLADLDELSDNEAYPEGEDEEARNMEEDGDGGMPCCEFLNHDDLNSASELHKTQRYNDIMQLLGAKKKNLSGFSTAASQFRVGYLEQTEVFQSTIPSLRTHACRIISAKSTLAARIDSIRGDPTGKAGHSLLEEICKKTEKLQELPPAKILKPLPVPDCMPKKKRGGCRLRKMKERYAQTDMMKLANRMQFGVPEESSLGDGLGKGYGLLGQAGSGKLRLLAGQSRLAAKVAKRFKARSCDRSESRSGLTSTLAFTPVQGMELSNPLVHNDHSVSGTQSTYFSDVGTFSSIRGKDAIPIQSSEIQNPGV
ncbi:Os02g0730100 [Oryza sativa Japonica Group]|uniref:Os02g0730100 protein n=1 Tax=Oryza sativa subsp. japonica TaxID=39947 RepID=Q0DXW3_ORYSJ|nr:Os02g0730100 [Oryza sativa Japonica Group]|eukprot:NP_001048011.2 Os02g0730100 [Oryza sativa Japonica Group]